MSKLFLVHYPEEPIAVPEKGSITIGRADDNTIVLDESRVSRHHAAIEWQKKKNTFVVRDEGSSNGTWLNTTRLKANEPHTVIDWDKIRIASKVFTVRNVNDPSIIENEFKELRDRVRFDATEILRVADISSGGKQSAFSGDLAYLCPVELLQMLESGRKSGNLTVKTTDGHGDFVVHAGDVISANFKSTKGEFAVYELLKCAQGSFEFSPGTVDASKPQILSNTTMLLMEGCRLLDEANAQPQGEQSEVKKAGLFEFFKN